MPTPNLLNNYRNPFYFSRRFNEKSNLKIEQPFNGICVKSLFANKYIVLLTSLILVLGSGCAKKSSRPKDRKRRITTAQQKLIDICKKDYKLNIVTTSYDNTLWIYLPTNKTFIEFKSNKEGPKIVREAKETRTVNFLDGQFENNIFNVQYDISLSRNYGKTFGYSSSTTEKYQKDQRNILTAIFRAYGPIGEPIDRDEYRKKIVKDITDPNPVKNAASVDVDPYMTKTKKAPDFFVVVLADTSLGMETKAFVAFKDIERAMRDPSFQEEYAKRVIIEQPIGHTSIIGDEEGRHLKTYDMTWGNFLIKQIIYRINFKYTRSAFPPSNDAAKEILTIVNQTILSYDFKDFTSARLEDLREEEESESIQVILKEDLPKYTPKKRPSKGRLHTIRFF